MPNKMERFTQYSRKLLSLSQETAETLKQSTIEVPHLLLAMTRFDKCDAHAALSDNDIIQQKLKPFLTAKYALPEKRKNAHQSIDLSDNFKRVLELSVDTALRKGHFSIGSAHLLIGIMRHENAEVDEILLHFDVQRKDIIKRAEYYLNDPHSEEGSLAEQRVRQYLDENQVGCLETIKNILRFNKQDDE